MGCESGKLMARCNTRFHALQCVLALSTALWVGGCSAAHYKMSADKEVYSIISEKSVQVPGMDASFRLQEPSNAESAAGEGSKGPLVLSLADAIVAAAAQSRDFRTRREGVYLTALALTYQRYLWGPRYTGGLSGTWARSGGESSLGADVAFGLSQALAVGGEVSVGLSSAFLTYLSGDPRKSAESLLELSIVQPLWRGSGKRVAQENLTQAERDMVYELRSFVRFRREFFVSVASDYYRILQQKDAVENEAVNLKNLTMARERAEMMAKAGRLPEYQVDQTRQNELQATARWVSAVEQYESLVDEFKITLGFPTDMSLQLDPAEMDRLRAAGLKEVSYTRPEGAAEEALKHRLDLANALDGVADAERKVEVAMNELGPALDFTASAGIGTEGTTKPLKFTTRDGSYSAGLELDLPLDRVQERNAYREALIALDREKRAYSLLHDQVVQQVYSAWRTLAAALKSYKIQQMSVDLAARRVDMTSVLMDAGRAQSRDLLEAQSALLGARNAFTSALVGYRIAMLDLYRDMDSLTFKDGEFTEANPDDEPTATP